MKINKPTALAILFPAWVLLGFWFGGFEFGRNSNSAILIFMIAPCVSALGYLAGETIELN